MSPTKYHKHIFFSVIFSLPILAGHPLNTDDAFTVGTNGKQLEIISEYYSYGTSYEVAVPVAFTYGLFKYTDLVVSVSYHRAWDNSFSTDSFNDIAFELKQVLYDNILRIGVKPFITLPTGSEEKGFGKGKLNYGTFLLVTKEWENLHLHTQFGYTRNNNIVNEKLDLWEYSIAIEKFFTEKFSTVLEFGISKNCCFINPEQSKFILGGIIYQWDSTVTFDLGIMKGFDRPHADIGVLLGATLGF